MVKQHIKKQAIIEVFIVYCTTQNITEKHIWLIYIRFINMKEIMTRITTCINND